MPHAPARRGLAALLVLVVPAAAPAAEPAPAPRPLYPRFDTEYLPPIEGQGVIGFRPAEIARHATVAQAERARLMLLSFCSQLLGGAELDPAAWPTFADIEQCVLSLDMRVTAPEGEEGGAFLVGAKTPGLIKTVRPFNWQGLFRKAFDTTPARHAGRAYLRVPVRFPVLAFFNFFVAPMAVYTPDDRTLVIGSEDEIQTLLDRLAAGDPAPAPPPGWDEVDRDLIALALDNRRERLVRGRFPADHPVGREADALGDSLQTLAVGLSVGELSRVRFVATARDEDGARVTASSLRALLAAGAVAAAGEKDSHPVEAFAAALLGGAELASDGRRVTGCLAAAGNIVEIVLAAIGGSD